MAERTLTVFSLSKSYAIAGHRLGYVVGAEAPMHALRKIANHTVYNVPSLLQRAALALVTQPSSRAWLDETRALYLAPRDEASRLLPAPHFVPDGATYLFADLSRWAPDGDLWPLVEKLLDAGVSIAPGEQFGAISRATRASVSPPFPSSGCASGSLAWRACSRPLFDFSWQRDVALVTLPDALHRNLSLSPSLSRRRAVCRRPRGRGRSGAASRARLLQRARRARTSRTRSRSPTARRRRARRTW